MLAVGPVSEKTGQREVFFEMNGEVRSIPIDDKQAGRSDVDREANVQLRRIFPDQRQTLAILVKLEHLRVVWLLR